MMMGWKSLEDFLVDRHGSCGPGRPKSDRGPIVRAFIAKAYLNIPTTSMLIEHLQFDDTLRRLCGWITISLWSRWSLQFENFFSGTDFRSGSFLNWLQNKWVDLCNCCHKTCIWWERVFNQRSPERLSRKAKLSHPFNRQSPSLNSTFA